VVIYLGRLLPEASSGALCRSR